MLYIVIPQPSSPQGLPETSWNILKLYCQPANVIADHPRDLLPETRVQWVKHGQIFVANWRGNSTT